ncbi:hypothetical protein [Actinacidiphila yeochonensis]|uniref:hypothetical protein n=1 Tax=Actinacidiphila yeochonensis TaxID=89050 RepID=UPI0005655A4B|nr:hypothetical protein [Actinacidiphila yeochonensis]
MGDPLADPGAPFAPELLASGAEPTKVRRRRPALRLTAAALVLGVLAGGGTGYWVQKRRAPTPLPPLATRVLDQPKGAGTVPEALPADEDGGAVFSGDLLKLLLPTPKGAHEIDRSWITLAQYASFYGEPAEMFVTLSDNDYQRGVEASWKDGKTKVTINLVQFRDEATAYTPKFFTNEEYYDYEITPDAIPGVVNGSAWGSGETPVYAGSDGAPYSGYANAQIGNLYVEMWQGSSKPVASSTMVSLMKRQLERM